MFEKTFQDMNRKKLLHEVNIAGSLVAETIPFQVIGDFLCHRCLDRVVTYSVAHLVFSPIRKGKPH